MYDGKDYDDINEPQDIPFDRVVQKTNMSWLLEVGESGPVWFPRSQCGMDKEPKESGGTVYVPYWLAREKGLMFVARLREE